MIEVINEMINTDFASLVQLLYKIDVDEAKLKQSLLENSDHDSANLIAEFIIQRQLKKIETRRRFSSKNKPGDEEKWE